jgi:hypothetical protein
MVRKIKKQELKKYGGVGDMGFYQKLELAN